MPISVQRLREWLSPNADRLELAPDGWATARWAANETYWSHFVDREEAACTTLIAAVRDGRDVVLLDPDERIKRVTFAEVIAVASRGRERMTVLDVGGNLGDYYWIARSRHPGVELDFHCLELPAVAAAGRRINPAVTFHTGEDVLDRQFDLIMFSSALQCMQHWQSMLARAARSADRYVFLSDVPTLSSAKSFVIAQHHDGHVNLHHQFNRGELLEAIAGMGLKVLREFDMGPHPRVRNAPEQSICTGWLLQRGG
ncbi:MAG TPA: hypothetical protein VFZ31_14215 [Vicinamibacterales bacterium]